MDAILLIVFRSVTAYNKSDDKKSEIVQAGILYGRIRLLICRN